MIHSDEAKRCALALNFVVGLGPVRARKLISHFEGPEEVFRQKKSLLRTTPGIGEELANRINHEKLFPLADRELNRIEKEGWLMHYLEDSSYPYRLKHAPDAPLLLFQKGHGSLNARRYLAVVGSRQMTDYGREFMEQFIPGLANFNVQIISGLAYGVDAFAHQRSLQENIINLAVVAHGLERLYPSIHHKIAKSILKGGGSILSEFPSGTNPDRENFPKRNRIIAGLSDAVVVVEASRKGGALITADLANQYNRDVFALPGNINLKSSAGCNHLIKSHRANLIESVQDLAYLLGWEVEEKPPQKTQQLNVFESLSDKEQSLINTLGTAREGMGIEDLYSKLQISQSEIQATLLNLELKGLLISLPGPRFKMKA